MKELIEYMKSTLPRYNVIQPSTGNTISYRPFTVREEKSLLIAHTTGTYQDFLITLSEIVDSCFELKIPSKKLPLFDVEIFFLKLRAKSVNEIAEPTIICPKTNEKIKLKVNLEEIQPKRFANHSREIKLSDKITVIMNYPTLETLVKKQGESSDYYDMIIDCIDKIETPEQLLDRNMASKETLTEFVDLLTKDQFLKIVEFFKTIPTIEKEVSYTTSDGINRTIVLKGLEDFF